MPEQKYFENVICVSAELFCNEIKLVITNNNIYTNGDDIGFYKEKFYKLNIPIYLQPEWNNKTETIPLTLELVKKYGYRLSLQTHKFIGVE